MRHFLHRSSIQCLLFATLIAAGSSTSADVRLPGFYTDHMVLQRDVPIRFRGWADPGQTVTVEFKETSVTATASQEGTWEVQLPAQEASSEAATLTFKSSNTITLKDVLIGEVWLCSGQSNMEWTVARSQNAKEEIAAADYPMIRHMKVGRKPSMVPLNDIKSEWQVCSPDTVAEFSACGYFMARRLHQELNVPIGLVNSSWGGTRVEPWTPPEGFAAVPAVKDTYQSVMGRTPGTDSFRKTLSGHLQATEAWLQKARTALKQGESVNASPGFPPSLVPFKSHQDPTMLYNGMIHALVGFPIKGAIWYQGESNHAEGMAYFEKKKALIGGWRQLWRQGDFPFYFVQIAPFKYGNEDGKILARFWEAQEAVLQIPRTGMVVTNDIATLNDIHPPNKQDVGLRLANLALKNDYGRSEIVASSPRLQSVEERNGTLVVRFTNTAGGLTTSDDQAPGNFELVGPGSDGFQPANAKLEGDTIILSSPSVSKPTAFRFAWDKLAEPNLRGGTGLPVGAVRGGRVPEFSENLPINREYRLVYDLDLSNLSQKIEYDQDHTREVAAFDRVAYLLELTRGDDRQGVFVSMDAWTDEVSKLKVPIFGSGIRWQTGVQNMDIQTNVNGLQSGQSLPGGFLEFWPNNYAANNEAGVPGASSSVYDFGDAVGPPQDGYGCMQVHNVTAKQTVFAINHWKEGSNADVGIGNSPGRTRDWTFTGNAKSYDSKRLRIFVREAKP